MKICSICNKISATGSDHTDCKQKRKVETNSENLTDNLPEKLDMAKNPNDLGVEIKAILDHLTKENTMMR